MLKNQRNVYLDYIRGISTLMVILYHYTTRYESLFPRKEMFGITFPHGSYAVLVFFLLSGYFAIRNIEQTTLVKYMIKRFLKLFPVYWVAILITMPLVATFLPSRSVSIKDMLLNFTMLQTILGAENVDGAYWTLFSELVFYIFIFLVLILKKQKNIDKFIFFYVLIQVILLVIPDTSMIILAKKFNTLIYGHCFMAGASIAYLEKYDNKQCVSIIEKIKAILVFFSLIFFIGEQFLLHDWQSGIFFVISTAVVVLAIFYHNRIGNMSNGISFLKPFSFIATISYPLYLLHQNIGYIIIRTLDSYGLSNEYFLIIPIGMVIVLAYSLHKFIEKPILKISNTICRRI